MFAPTHSRTRQEQSLRTLWYKVALVKAAPGVYKVVQAT